MQAHQFGLFFKPQNDASIYHVNCKKIFPSNNINSLEDDYDFEFFFNNYHVTCKLLPQELILDILNKEVYGMDFDYNALKCRCLLTLNQKLNLKLSLKQILPSYFMQYNFPIPQNEVVFESNEYTSSFQIASVEYQNNFNNNYSDHNYIPNNYAEI